MKDIEKEVLRLVIAGKSNQEISEELNYSVGSIKKFIRSLFKFFKVRKRVDLVRESMLFLYFNK